MNDQGEWQSPSKCHSGECVEVRFRDNGVDIRRVQDHVLMWWGAMSHEEWAALADAVKAGEFDSK